MDKSLLVVDWDYFFPNPWEGGFKDPAISLYDWAHAETGFLVDIIWPTRAATFLSNNLRLPTVESSWKTFADRFTLADDAMVYIGDSNGHAGNLWDSEDEPFSDVWLYDAHHDAGYGVKTLEKWMERHVGDERTSFSCEDWMLVHYIRGSRLHWRIPTWHENFKRQLAEGKSLWPNGVEIDAAIDDLAPHQTEFDTVYICRSGAWVPAWEDKKFLQFTGQWDRDVEQLDNTGLDRHFNMSAAREEARLIKEVMSTIK